MKNELFYGLSGVAGRRECLYLRGDLREDLCGDLRKVSRQTADIKTEHTPKHTPIYTPIYTPKHTLSMATHNDKGECYGERI